MRLFTRTGARETASRPLACALGGAEQSSPGPDLHEMVAVMHLVREALATEVPNLKRFDMPVVRRLWLYRHGFTSSRGPIYRLRPDTVDQYLNDVQHMRTTDINGDAKVALEDKLLFHLLLSDDHDRTVPELLCRSPPDEAVAPAPNGSIATMADLESALRGGRAVVKPRVSSGGFDVHVLSADADSLAIDGTPTTRSAFVETLAEMPDSIVVEYVSQADYARRIYPDSTNTLRLLTMLDVDSGEPFVAAAVHRFGAEDSGVVDNWSSGGLSAPVDRGTGELGTAAVSPKGDRASPGPARVSRHPDTGSDIRGTVVPGWDSIVSAVLDLASSYRSLWPYVGWDVLVTSDTGELTVLEGNAIPDVDLLQAHRPLLDDPRVRRFYDHHGVL